MGEDVKTDFPMHRVLSVLHPGVRPRGCPEVAHTLLVWEQTGESRAIPETLRSMVTASPFSSGIPGDIAAASLSIPEWEPTIYWGLLGPLLCSALRGGIAYEWGLRTHRPGPTLQWMLTPKPISSPSSAPGTTNTFTSDLSNPGTGYVVFNLVGS